jgi:hypothetical protein
MLHRLLFATSLREPLVDPFQEILDRVRADAKLDEM